MKSWSIFTTTLELILSKIREKNNRPPRRMAGRAGTNSPLKTQWAALCAAHENFQKKGKGFILERVGGIEPPATAWKAVVLPLYDTRTSEPDLKIRKIQILF